MQSNYLILLSIFLVAFASAAIPKDKITSLPYYDGDLGTQYSGYIEVNSTTGQYLHYWFVQSTGNPKTDPVVLWMNGGPGCSSMDGFFYEHGPLHFNVGNGQNNVSLYYNKWTWTTMANMLYLEAPAGVGFSYSNDQNDYNTDDTTTAYYNHRFLDLFFQSYPEFSTNPFYISGESYAGVYVPSLATLVAADSSINFKGILVGNGVTDPNADGLINSFAPFVYGHGLIPMSVYSDIMEYCQNNTGGDNCNNALYAAEAAVEGLNPYDIYIDCFSQRPAQSRSKRSADVDVPCIDSDAADYYLNLPSVQAAIHVNSDITWSICSNSINYSPNIDTMIPYYKKLIAAGVRILVYSGDVDSVVPYTGTAYWTSNLGLKVNSLWQPWFVSHPDGTQVGGYVTEYEGLTYATVRGSGHMVPQYKPEAAFYMFQSFINGTWGGN